MECSLSIKYSRLSFGMYLQGYSEYSPQRHTREYSHGRAGMSGVPQQVHPPVEVVERLHFAAHTVVEPAAQATPLYNGLTHVNGLTPHPRLRTRDLVQRAHPPADRVCVDEAVAKPSARPHLIGMARACMRPCARWVRACVRVCASAIECVCGSE